MELSELRPLFAGPGPWASVYLDATRAEENAAHQIDLRWRALADRLATDGADPATVDAIGTAIHEHPYRPGRYGLAIFAAGGNVALAEPLPAPPPADLAVWEPLPHLMPMIAQRGEEIPYVRVAAGHAGGDVSAIDADGVPRRREVAGGETFPLRKVHAGGWSHLRYLHAVEETWKRNAGDVAAAAAELAGRIGAEVILVAGDPHEVPLVVERLPARWRERVVTANLTGGSEHLDDVTVQAIAEVADQHARAAIERYGEGPAAGGLSDVVTRLQRGQADTVLLIDDPSSTDRLWIGLDDFSLVAAEPDLLRQSGVEDPVEVRADAALLRAIAGTGADLVLVAPGEAELPHGIGAILRYRDGQSAA
ncbi:Vms1/Ankzf1 family peptidyl-tRNA hydrolase [Actinoplanes sp. CA-030573]|uniref:baeRF2 domain-containing protein n=1 Tax=Actinoplanes sp. CA-030573 TaxID=3239898 RepID=UPI003D8B89A8